MKKITLGTFGNQSAPFCIYAIDSDGSSSTKNRKQKKESDTIFYCLQEVNAVFFNDQLSQSLLSVKLPRKDQNDDINQLKAKEAEATTAQLQRASSVWDLDDFMKAKDTGSIFIKPKSLLPIARSYSVYCLAELCKLSLEEIKASVAAPLFNIIRCPHWHQQYSEEIHFTDALVPLSVEEWSSYVIHHQSNCTPVSNTTHNALSVSNMSALESTTVKPPFSIQDRSTTFTFTANTKSDLGLKQVLEDVSIVKLQQQAIIETRQRKIAFANKIPLTNASATTSWYTSSTSATHDNSFSNYKRRRRQKKLTDTEHMTTSMALQPSTPSSSIIAGQFRGFSSTALMLPYAVGDDQLQDVKCCQRQPNPGPSQPCIVMSNSDSSSRTAGIGIKRKQSTSSSTSNTSCPLTEDAEGTMMAVSTPSLDNNNNTNNKRQRKDNCLSNSKTSSSFLHDQIGPSAVTMLKEHGIDNLYLLATQAAQLIPLPLSPERSPSLPSPTFYRPLSTESTLSSSLPSIQTIFPDLNTQKEQHQQHSAIHRFYLPAHSSILPQAILKPTSNETQEGISSVASPTSQSFYQIYSS